MSVYLKSTEEDFLTGDDFTHGLSPPLYGYFQSVNFISILIGRLNYINNIRALSPGIILTISNFKTTPFQETSIVIVTGNTTPNTMPRFI